MSIGYFSISADMMLLMKNFISARHISRFSAQHISIGRTIFAGYRYEIIYK